MKNRGFSSILKVPNYMTNMTSDVVEVHIIRHDISCMSPQDEQPINMTEYRSLQKTRELHPLYCLRFIRNKK